MSLALGDLVPRPRAAGASDRVRLFDDAGVLLLGIGLGSYVATPLLKRERPWLLILSVLELTLAMVAVLSIQTLSYTHAW